MKITVKKKLIIFHRPSEWSEVAWQLRNDYGASIMISFTCKQKLGFTVRHHKGLVPHDAVQVYQMKEEGWGEHRYHYKEQIHLDFYNEAQQTWFLLKYLNL